MMGLFDELPVCEKDYKGRHYFEMIGVWRDDFILYRCSQCRKCVYEEIKGIIKGGI